VRVEGKLINTEGEFIASGPCEVDRDRGEVTMWPSWELHMLERERGALTLELDNGARLHISERHLTFKLKDANEQRISVYRLRILERVPEHLAAGYEPASEQEQQIAAEIAAEEAGREKQETLHTW
jgi:hypothetical protein